MIPLPWSPKWYCAGASLWALAARIAFVSTASIRTVIEFLVGPALTHRALMWFGSRGTIARVGEQLRLPPQWAASAFCSISALPLSERVHYRLALRWCPECLAMSYHSPLFQDVRVVECPVHKTPLLERCPSCKRFIDPLAMHPWCCPACHQVLAPAPTNWRQAFVDLCPPVGTVERSAVPWARAEDGASLWVAPAGLQGLDDPYAMNMGLFEYLSALWECIGDHRQCALRENVAAMGQYRNFEFQCPVAAAFLRAGLVLGIESEPRGGWPSFRRSYAEWHPDRSLPAWATPFVVQEQLRLFILSALQLLGSISKCGWSEALWSLEDAGRVQVTTTSRGLFISNTVSDDELLSACREAAKTCRTPPAPAGQQSLFDSAGR